MSEPTVASSPSIHIHTIEHQLTKDEIFPIFYWQVLHRWQNWCLPVAGICLVIAGAIVSVLDSVNKLTWVVMLALGLAMMLIFFALVPVTPKRIWRRVKKQFEVRTLDISEEGISRHTALNDTTMRWPMFSDLKLRNDLYLLVVGKGPGCFIIPKRAFTSQADEMKFRDLAEQSTLRTLIRRVRDSPSSDLRPTRHSGVGHDCTWHPGTKSERHNKASSEVEVTAQDRQSLP